MDQLRGFSLIELVVVLALVAAVSLAAVPSYRQLILRSHRTEAAAALLDVAAAQERHHAQYGIYATGLSPSPPGGLGLSAESSNGRYRIEITDADVARFEVTATAQGPQSADTHCSTFRLDDRGARTATSDNCWVR